MIDNATVSLGQFASDVTATPSGSVSFYICGPLVSASNCTSTAHQVGGAVTVTHDTTAQ